MTDTTAGEGVGLTDQQMVQSLRDHHNFALKGHWPGVQVPHYALAGLFKMAADRIEALAAQPSAGAQGEAVDWSEYEDDIADVISDSIDLGWNSHDGAKAVVRWLDEQGPLYATPAQPDTSAQGKIMARLEAVANLIERPPLDDVLLDQSTALALAADIRAIIAAPAQIGTGVALSASDRACYDYPGVDQGPLRDAFVAGAAAYAQPDTGSHSYGWNEDMTRLPAALTLIFRDPVDADGCEMVRFGLSTDAMNATAWSYLPGVAQPDTSLSSKSVDVSEGATAIDKPDTGDVAALREALERALVGMKRPNGPTIGDVDRVERTLAALSKPNAPENAS